MLSAHAQRLLFGLAWFVKGCFLHGGLPSRKITTGHALYNETFAKSNTTKWKCLERMHVRQITRLDGSS